MANSIANLSVGVGYLQLLHLSAGLTASEASVLDGDGTASILALGTNSATVGGNLVVSGNLTVSGTTTTVNTETINLADNIITLNSNATGTPTENAGFEVERGTSTNTAVRWNETADRWEFTNDGSTYYNIPISTEYNNNTYSSSDFTHDDLSGVTANEHIDWTISQGSNIHADNYTSTDTVDMGDGFRLVDVDSNVQVTENKYVKFKTVSGGTGFGNIASGDGSSSTPWVYELSYTDTNTTYSVVSTSADGLAPTLPASHGGKFLRGDGTWVVPPDTDTVYTHPTTAGNKHIPTGGSSGQFLGYSASGTAQWVANPNTDTVDMGDGFKITDADSNVDVTEGEYVKFTTQQGSGGVATITGSGTQSTPYLVTLNYADTNTQLSDADVGNYGYIKNISGLTTWTVKVNTTNTSAMTSASSIDFVEGSGITLSQSLTSNAKTITISSDLSATAVKDLGDVQLYAPASLGDGDVLRWSDSGDEWVAQALSLNYLPLAGGTMSNTNVVTNLNADLLDGQHGSYYSPTTHTHSYLPLSGGGTLSGAVTGSSPLLKLQTTGTGNWLRGMQLFNSGLNSGDELLIQIGKDDTNRDVGQVYFHYAGNQSNSNRISMGLHSVDDAFNVMGSGNVLIGTTTDSGYKLYVNGTTKINGSLTGTSASFSGQVEGSQFYTGGLLIRANNDTYASMRVTGNMRNGYEGIKFNSGNKIMMNETLGSACGFYNNSHGWSILSYTTGAVNLYYSASQRLSTTSGGVAITGALTATGDITAYYSDARLKTDVREIDKPLEKLQKIRGVHFKWNDEEINVVRKRSGTNDVGLIAQEVESVLPDLVFEYDQDLEDMGDMNGKKQAEYAKNPVPRMSPKYKTIKYDKLTALLVEGSKELIIKDNEQDLEIKRLQDRVKYLEAQIGES